MTENLTDLFIELSVDGADNAELNELTNQLKAEVRDLNVDSVEMVSAGTAPEGTKALESGAIGQMLVTLAPTVIHPLFELLRSWIQRKPAVPVKIKVKVGRNKTVEIIYDPTKTSAEDLDKLIKALDKTVKK